MILNSAYGSIAPVSGEEKTSKKGRTLIPRTRNDSRGRW